jgi:hypothetical protein
MKIVVWVLAAVGALVLLGAVVLPLVHWLLGALLWLVPGVLVVGGGIWLARRAGRGGEVRAPEPRREVR